jgi:hypothetical protein
VTRHILFLNKTAKNISNTLLRTHSIKIKFIHTHIKYFVLYQKAKSLAINETTEAVTILKRAPLKRN